MVASYAALLHTDTMNTILLFIYNFTYFFSSDYFCAFARPASCKCRVLR
eukprot:SAG11_NODE_29354_length_311_cov_4.382075_1_plen_48_part_10